MDYLLFFITGLIIGSFLNVVIYRLPRKESVIFPASSCPYCGTRLHARDLVPVISFIWTGGKCRYCAEPISWQYPAVELIAGFLFLIFYAKYGISSNLIIYLVFLSLLIICSMIDLRSQIIPNRITYPGIILGLVLALFFDHITFNAAVLGLLIPAGFLLIIAFLVKKGMGMGDVKLAAMAGAFIGWQHTILGIFIGALFGSIIGLTLIGTGKIERKTRIPFGPFISAGVILALLVGERLLNWYLKLYL